MKISDLKPTLPEYQKTFHLRGGPDLKWVQYGDYRATIKVKSDGKAKVKLTLLKSLPRNGFDRLEYETVLLKEAVFANADVALLSIQEYDGQKLHWIENT